MWEYFRPDLTYDFFGWTPLYRLNSTHLTFNGCYLYQIAHQRLGGAYQIRFLGNDVEA